MDIIESVPVRLGYAESIAPVFERVRERIQCRAYEHFLDRGCVAGHDVDDWLDAEDELILKPGARVRIDEQDIFVEMILPEIDLPNLTVYIAPFQLVIWSDPAESGLQIFEIIDLPCQILEDGVDAEQLRNRLHIAAALAEAAEPQLI